MNVNRVLHYLGMIVVFGLTWTLLTQPAAAAIYTWDDGANSSSGPTDGSGTWGTTSNWWNGSGYQVWNNATDDTAVFGVGSGGSTAEAVSISTVAPGIQAGGVTFNNQNYTLSSSTLTLGGATPYVTVNAAAATISSVLAGSGGLVKSGTGLLTLSAANNNFSGNLTVSQGTLQVSSVGASSGMISLGDANTGASNVQLNLNSNSVANAVTVSGSGSGTAIISYLPASSAFTLGLGNVTLNGPATFTAPNLTGYIQVNAFSGSGQLTVGSTDNQRMILNTAWPSFTGNITILSGAVFEPANALTSTSGNSMTVNAGGTLQVDYTGYYQTALSIGGLNGNGTVLIAYESGTPLGISVGEGNSSGSFSGTLENGSYTLPLAKTGTGTQTLSGANIIYTGATTLTQGTLNLTNATGFASAVTMDPSNTVDLQLNATSGTAWTFSQQINGGSTNAIIEKVGPGTVVLNPASGSTFQGSSTAALTVTAGALYLTNTNLNNFGAPAIAVASAGTLGGNTTVGAATVASGGGIVGGYSGAGQLTLASLTYSGSGTAAGVLSAGTPPIVVNGSVTANPASIAISPTNLPADGTYPFLSYTGTDPFSDFTLSTNVVGRTVLTLVDSSGSDLIALTLTTSAYPIWTGRYSGDWSLATEPSPKNWKVNAGGATDFLAGDKAVFDDSVGTAGTTNVTLNNGNVNPGSVTFNNNLYNYTLSGTAGITTGSLTLNGSAAVTINTANSFGGGTTLNAGILIVSNNAALGGGGLLINGGSLQPAGGPIALSNPVTASGNFAIGANTNSLTLNGTLGLNSTGTSTITVNGTGGVVFANVVTGNNLVQSGMGMLTLSASSSFSGTVTVSQGTLQLNNAGAAGTAPITLGDGNSGSANMQLNINDPGVANAITVSGSGSGMATIAYLPAVGSTGYSSAAQSITVNGATTFTAPNLTGYLLFYPSLSGSGGLAIGTTNNQRLIVQTDQSAFTGNIEVQSGAVFEPRGYFDSPNGNNITVDSGATLNVWFSPLVMNGLSGSGTVSSNYSGGGPLTVGAGNGSGVFSGSFVVGGNGSPSPGLIKTGTGTQELSGAGINYTFATTLTQGTLRLTNATGWASPITMDYNNTVDLQLNNTSGTAWTFSQPINGGSSNSIIEKVGPGTVLLAPASGSTFQGSGSGALTVTQGALYVTNSNLSSFAPPPVAIASGGIFGGNTTVGAATVAAGGGIVGGYSGAGQLTLASLTYSGTGTAAGFLSAGTPPIVVSGSVTANPASIAVSPTNLPANGTYPFLSYTGTDPFSDFTLSTKVIGRTVLSLVDSSGSDLIALTVTTSAYPIWTGKASGDWSLNVEPNPKNWRLNTGGTTDFLANDSAVFDDSVGTAGTTNVTLNNGNVNPGSVTFNNNLYNYTLSGTAGITTGSLTLNGSAAVTINTANSFGGGTTLNAGTLIVGNNSALGSGGLLINGGWLQPAGGPIALSNPVTANGDFAIGAGTNSLTLNGTVNLNPTSGTSTITVNGTGGVVFANVVSGNNLVKSGTGMLTLTGANSFTGSATVSQGMLTASFATANLGGNTNPVVQVDNGATLNLVGAGSVTDNAAITLAAGSTLNLSVTSAGNSLLSQPVEVTGNAVINLSHSGNNYRGNGFILDSSTPVNVTVNCGSSPTLAAGWLLGGDYGYDRGPTAAGQLALGSTLLFNGTSTSGTAYGSGTPGTLYATTAVGWAALANTDLTIGNTPTTAGVAILIAGNAGGTFQVNSLAGGTGPLTYIAADNFASTVQINNGTASGAHFAGTIANGAGAGVVSLVMSGTGTQILSGQNTFTGSTSINGGTLQLGDGTPGQDGSINGTNGVTDNSTLLYDLAGGQTASYAINGSGNLIKAGSGMLVLAGANGYSGATTVSGGTLQLLAGNGFALGSGALAANGGVLDLEGNSVTVTSFGGAAGTVTDYGTGGGTTTLTVNQSTITNFGGTIANGPSNLLALTLDGPGTLILTGTNTYSGGTTVTDGTLVLASPTALADGSSLTVGQGASALFAPAVAGPVAGAVAKVAAVPEPGTLALLAVALWSAVACYRFSRRKKNLELRTWNLGLRD